MSVREWILLSVAIVTDVIGGVVLARELTPARRSTN
jgi:hypothetical protein